MEDIKSEVEKMDVKEKIEIIEMLHKLPEQKQWEIYFMIKGAALVAEKDEKRQKGA